MPCDSFLQNRSSYHFGMADSAIDMIPNTVNSDGPSITLATSKPLRLRLHRAVWEEEKYIGVENRFATSNSSNIKDLWRGEFVSKPSPLPAFDYSEGTDFHFTKVGGMAMSLGITSVCPRTASS